MNTLPCSQFIRRYGLLVLTLVFAALLHLDWPALLGLLPNEGRQPANTVFTARSVDEPAREFLLKQYENAVKEIQERIQQESLLFAMKFSLVGAILVLMLSTGIKCFDKNGTSAECFTNTVSFNAVIVAMFCWAAAITSAIIDTRIMYHCDVIGELGRWINHYVEPYIYGQSGMLGWENYITDKNNSRLFTSRLYSLLRIDINALTFFLFSSCFVMFSTPFMLANRYASQYRIICASGSTVCFFIFFLVSLNYHYDEYIQIFRFNINWIFICLVILYVRICTGLEVGQAHVIIQLYQ